MCVCRMSARKIILFVSGHLKTDDSSTLTCFQKKKCSRKDADQYVYDVRRAHLKIIIIVYSPSKTRDLDTSQQKKLKHKCRKTTGWFLSGQMMSVKSHLPEANIKSDSKYNIRILWAFAAWDLMGRFDMSLISLFSQSKCPLDFQ